MKQLSLLFIAASLFLTLAFVAHKDTSTRHTPMDTLPKYRYFFTLPNTDGYLRSEDSVKMILQNLGKTLSVDQAEEYRKFAFRHLFLMERYHVMDSVLLETKSVVKKGGK